MNQDNIDVRFISKTFQFYDRTNRLIGGFTIKDLIQFIIGSKIFNNLNHSDANIVIEQYVLTRENKCHFKSHTNSSFMGNIGLLIILNNEYSKYIENNFKTELALFNEEIQNKIEFVVNRRLYELSDYTLSLFDIVLEEIKKDPKKTSVVFNLHTYSIKILHQMNECLYNEMKMLSKKYHKIKKGKFEIPEVLERHKEEPKEKKSNEICEKMNTLPKLKPENKDVSPEEIKFAQKINDELSNRYIESSEYIS